MLDNQLVNKKMFTLYVWNILTETIDNGGHLEQ